MRKWRNHFSSFMLRWFDFGANFRDNISFGKSFFKISKNGFALSILLLIFLLVADYAVRTLVYFLDSFPSDSFACQFAEVAFNINHKIGLKNIDYLADVVSIGAGVLGVILGLFYTAFMTIIATKYSNINSVISFQLLEQKSINRYFVLLATLTSLAILFQLCLSLGYNPTLISCFLFSILVIATLTSFIRYGKFSLIYFDTSYLVNDLIKANYRTLSKIIKRKANIEALGKGKIFLSHIYQNINKIQLIISESESPQTRNTSLNLISNNLLNFSISYNSVKHNIPSKRGWHLQKRKFKRWEEAREWNFDLLKSVGVGILPETVDDYNLIERKIIDTQFELFHQYINDVEQIEALRKQYEYLQVTAIQCDFEIIEYFFDKLQKFIIEKLQADHGNQVFRLQLISLYLESFIAHLVGFNHNLSVLDNTSLKKLAKAIHFDQNTDKILQFPYFIRKWLDTYREKLNTEKALEGKIITPNFYTTFELAQIIQHELQQYWKKIVYYCSDNIEKFTNTLVASKNNLEALQLNMQSIELCQKINLFTATTNVKITSLNELNFQKHDSPFDFKKRDELLQKNKMLNEQILDNIWEFGGSAYQIKKKEFPDMYGNVYHLILNDIIDKLLAETPDKKIILKILPRYLSYCALYIEDLREKYKDSENIEFSASRLFPIIMDMYEVNAIAILIGKIHDKKEITEGIFGFFGEIHKTPEDELNFWGWMNSIHAYFKHMMYGLGTPSYIKEYDRKQRFEKYLIENGIARKEHLNEGIMRSFIEYYVTDIPDVYVQAVIGSMHLNSISFIELDEMFVEFYLRTRISLKKLNIKETRYGEKLRRTMEK